MYSSFGKKSDFDSAVNEFSMFQASPLSLLHFVALPHYFQSTELMELSLYHPEKVLLAVAEL